MLQIPTGRLPCLALTVLFSLPPTDAELPAPPADLGPPPSGFSWQSIPEIKAHFLLPEGWSFQQVDDLLDLDYVLTPEPIETVHDLQMGLRISVMFETERKSGIPATEFGQATADLFEKRGGVRGRKRRQQGAFEIIDLIIEPPTDPCCLTLLRIFANTETDTLYWISFTSFGENWDHDWERFGSRISDGFVLESEV